MDISGISNRPGSQSVSDAIKRAADATGASFEYLLATAKAESRLNSQATSTTSSARGLYQFIDQTWLAMMKQSGASLGFAGYADAIVQTASGHFEVPGPGMRRDIMALRDDPAANAALAGALTRDNAALLAGRLGRKASDGELYIAHVLGSAGAVKLTTLAAVDPGAAADAAFPAAAEANRAIFYDRLGRPRSVSQVYGFLVGRYDGARGLNPLSFDGAKGVAGATSTGVAAKGPPGMNPAAATTHSAPAADTDIGRPTSEAAPNPSRQEPLFQGLFSDRREAVSQLVRDLWTERTQATATPSGPPPAWSASSAASLVAASGSRPLFQTQPDALSGVLGR
jgi:transglycosylase-like protein with SLT domain